MTPRAHAAKSSTIQLGVALRNMGSASQPDTLRRCALAAESAGLESIWVVDHVAIPPDDAEGSDGRYLDPLATLAWIAGFTSRIKLGVAVLVLPYRPALPTAKWLASLQELSGGRLLLGVGAGWMEPEFRALGVDRRQRGRLTDEVLSKLREWFGAAGDIGMANGEPFYFRPNPPAPPIYVGGAPDHAFARVLRFGDGWLPMGGTPDKLALKIAMLRQLALERGRPEPECVCLGALPWREPAAAVAALRAYRDAGVTRFVHGERYAEAGSFEEAVAAVSEAGRAV